MHGQRNIKMWCHYYVIGFKERKEIHANEELFQILRKNSFMPDRNGAQ